MSKKVAVVAIGGNSLIKDEKHKSVEDQYQASKETTYHIADMIEAGWDVAIGHGNGPQVGFILRRSEIAAKTEGMHEVPLDVCGADSSRCDWLCPAANSSERTFQTRHKKTGCHGRDPGAGG